MNDRTTDHRSSDIVKTDHISECLAVATGLAQSGKPAILSSLGRIAQGARKGEFLGQVAKEWSNYRQSGQIHDSFPDSECGKNCLYELFEFLDNGDPSRASFEFVKRLFFAAATTAQKDPDDWLPRQLLAIARQLNPNEIRVIHACYSLGSDSPSSHKINDYASWSNAVLKESALIHREFVALAYSSLNTKGLLVDRQFPDQSGITLGRRHGLTNLGIALLEYAMQIDTTDH